MALALILLAATYTVNMLYITVFYHRGFAHQSVLLGPRMTRLVAVTGPWMCGLDPLAWSAMHRLHHQHSDTELDPHSPRVAGILGVFKAQLVSYEKALRGLKRGDPELRRRVADIGVDVHWLYRRRLWYLPYAVHALVAVGIAVGVGSALPGAAYFLGLMSHPVQGWAVNSLGHAVGYRNFETDDASRNNTLVAYLVMGEGFQNNHHRYPTSARFSARWWEFDLGYGLCLLAAGLRLVRLR